MVCLANAITSLREVILKSQIDWNLNQKSKLCEMWDWVMTLEVGCAWWKHVSIYAIGIFSIDGFREFDEFTTTRNVRRRTFPQVLQCFRDNQLGAELG